VSSPNRFVRARASISPLTSAEASRYAEAPE
jgi:hypothetical protein